MNKKVTVHALSGSKTHRSDASLLILKECLGLRGVDITITQINAENSNDPDPAIPDEYDVLLVFCDDVILEPKFLDGLRSWCLSGKPLFVIQAVAGHAFRNWPEFDLEFPGAAFDGSAICRGESRVDVEAFHHPLVQDITGWMRPLRTEGNPQFAEDITVLLSETGPDGPQPAAWCRTHPQTGGKIFSTSLGALPDFGNSKFIDLLHRACLWGKGLAGAPSGGKRYLTAQLDETPSITCSCGTARRAFMVPEISTASVHMVDISIDAKVHYHKKLTEIYLVLEGEGHLELDGDMVPVRPLSTVMIKPGCRHRAVGKMRIINIPVPPFDPSDEWYE